MDKNSRSTASLRLDFTANKYYTPEPTFWNAALTDLLCLDTTRWGYMTVS